MPEVFIPIAANGSSLTCCGVPKCRGAGLGTGVVLLPIFEKARSLPPLSSSPQPSVSSPQPSSAMVGGGDREVAANCVAGGTGAGGWGVGTDAGAAGTAVDDGVG